MFAASLFCVGIAQAEQKEGTLDNWNFLQEHDSPVNKHLEEEDSFESKFIRMLVILGFLIGFMILSSWILKKMMRSRVQQMNTSSDIKLYETRPLSPRCTLYLVEVEGRRLLIAESPSNITHIASFDAVDDS